MRKFCWRVFAVVVLSVVGPASLVWANEIARGDRFGQANGPNGVRVSGSDRMPTMPYDPESRAGRYLDAVLAGLSDRTARLSVASPITTRDLGSVVEILFPGLGVHGGRVRLGDVGIRIKPREKSRYDFDLSWNGRAGFHAGSAKPWFIIAADPRLKGQWDAELQVLTEFDGETGAVDLLMEDERFATARIVSANHKLVRGGEGRWSEASTLRVSDFDLRSYERNGALRTGDVRIEFRRDGFDPAAWRLFSDAFANWRTSRRTNEDLAGLAKKLEAVDIGEGHGEMRFADVEIVGDNETMVSLGKLVLRVDYKEMSGKLSVALASPYVPKVPSHFLPESAAADVEILGFPLREFFVAMSDKRAWEVGEGLSGLQPRLLSQAGRDMEIRVSGFKMNFPPAEANAHGTLRLDGGGGLVGELRARITGLNEFFAALPKAALREAMVPVTLLKGLGRPVSGDDGRIAYAYDIDFSSGGPVTVNGLPMGLTLRRK